MCRSTRGWRSRRAASPAWSARVTSRKVSPPGWRGAHHDLPAADARPAHCTARRMRLVAGPREGQTAAPVDPRAPVESVDACDRLVANKNKLRPKQVCPREKTMRHELVGSLTAAAAIMLLSSTSQLALAQGEPALTGVVSSAQQGPMEGVVVSAKKPGSTVKVSVTTDAQGRYRFPENRLEPGEYDITIRAVGYDIGAPTKA